MRSPLILCESFQHMLRDAIYNEKKAKAVPDMVKLYRVRKRAPKTISQGTFVVRSAPSGGQIVTIDRKAYKAAKRAASKKLVERLNVDAKKQAL